jgi:uncharacterized protein
MNTTISIAEQTAKAHMDNGQIRRISKFWEMSREIYTARHPLIYLHRARLVMKAMRKRQEFDHWFDAPSGSSLRYLVDHRPTMMGAVGSPYFCLNWTPDQRLAAIREHHNVVDTLPKGLNIPLDTAVRLVDLSHVKEGVQIIVDRPVWFIREGEMTISLAYQGERIFFIAFNLARVEGKLVAYIGAVQGRRLPDIQTIYRELGKAFQGMRARDLLFDTFRFFCKHLGVQAIYGLKDASRIHHDPFLGKKLDPQALKYEDVWVEKGGVPFDDNFYFLEVNPRRRPIEEVPDKRPMYKRRYALLDAIDAQVESVSKDFQAHWTKDLPRA